MHSISTINYVAGVLKLALLDVDTDHEWEERGTVVVSWLRLKPTILD